MADHSNNLSFEDDEGNGQAQMKPDRMGDRAREAARSAKLSCQEAGQQLKAYAQAAADVIKDKTGKKKQC